MSSLRKKLQSVNYQETDTTLWMLPYSTLMLILMVFFVILIAFKRNDVEYETAIAAMKSSDGKASLSAKDVNLARDLKEYIEKQQLSDKAQVTISALAIKLDLSTPALFDSGNAELKPGVMPLLENLLLHLKDMENTIVVEGHTDNVPIKTERFGSNWELSSARAFSVIHHFLRGGIAPERLVAHGYGEFRPLASNETEEGRAKNRRIEITILRGSEK